MCDRRARSRSKDPVWNLRLQTRSGIATIGRRFLNTSLKPREITTRRSFHSALAMPTP